jgi:hypothetical protein
VPRDQTAGAAGDFDPSGVPPHQDPAGEAEHEEKVKRATDLLRRSPEQMKADPEAAFEKGNLELLAFARRHLPGAWVAFKQACRRLGVIRDLERAIADLERANRPRNGGDYARDATGIYYLTFDSNGHPVRVKLTNFDAEIVAVTVADDGVERRRHLSVDCVFEGAPASVLVPAADFNAMGWVGAELPANAYVLPSQERRARSGEPRWRSAS